MRLRNIPGARERIADSRFVVPEGSMKEKKGRWREVFGNENPLYIEVGMGKGRFITELAVRNPDRNYIGIEKYSSVLLRALEKREELQKIKTQIEQEWKNIGSLTNRSARNSARLLHRNPNAVSGKYAEALKQVQEMLKKKK